MLVVNGIRRSPGGGKEASGQKSNISQPIFFLRKTKELNNFHYGEEKKDKKIQQSKRNETYKNMHKNNFL